MSATLHASVYFSFITQQPTIRVSIRPPIRSFLLENVIQLLHGPPLCFVNTAFAYSYRQLRISLLLHAALGVPGFLLKFFVCLFVCVFARATR